MKAEWMGRYRELVAMLVQHSNTVARSAFESYEISEDVFLTHVGWQVLEHLIEHEDEPSCMNHVSEALGIPQSSFSKISRRLTELELVERYRIGGNRKNVILKPTEKARRIYESHSRLLLERNFRSLFDRLDSLDDESIAVFSQALNEMNRDIARFTDPPKEIRLIKEG